MFELRVPLLALLSVCATMRTERCVRRSAPLSTTISILGGVGLFLLGMTVMTDGLKGLAGSALRNVLERAAATPLRGAWWGAVLREGRGRSSRLPLGGRRAPVSRLSA